MFTILGFFSFVILCSSHASVTSIFLLQVKLPEGIYFLQKKFYYELFNKVVAVI